MVLLCQLFVALTQNLSDIYDTSHDHALIELSACSNSKGLKCIMIILTC